MIKAIAMAAALSLAVPAHAQNATVDPDHIIQVLKDAGYSAEYFNEEMDYRQILSKSGNYNFLIEMYDCEDGKSCDTLEFYSNFPMDEAPTQAKLDAYSGPSDGARLSLDRRGEARVQKEFDLSGGAPTDEQFLDKLKTWETVLANVAAYLHGQPAPGAAAAPAAAEAPVETAESGG